jgi:ribonuclease T2
MTHPGNAPAMPSPARGAGRVAPLTALIAAALMLAGSASPAPAAQDNGGAAPGAFDYYVLALTSEPGFCHTTPRQSQECSAPQGFALHGLWPQYEGPGNRYPQYCGGPALSAQARARYAQIYADPSLIDHEWPKHGTCSGLSQEDYFTLSAADTQRVVIPPAYMGNAVIPADAADTLKAALLAANPGMSPDGVHIATTGGVVTEIDVCLTKTGDFRAC